VLNQAPRHEDVLGEWRYSPTRSLTSALDGSEWLTSRPGRFIPHGKSPWYPLDRRLAGPQSRSGRDGEEKNSQPPPGIEPRSSGRPSHSQSLYRLNYPDSIMSLSARNFLHHVTPSSLHTTVISLSDSFSLPFERTRPNFALIYN
jgi:hypothetical protein